MKVLITGGGTGGHVYPALAVASALRSLAPEIRLLYVGRPESIESRLASENSIEFCPLAAKSVGLKASPGALARLGAGVVQAARLLRTHNPSVVLGTGGYASTAICLAQGIRRKPLVLVEGNSIPGRTNRILSRFSSLTCTTFEISDNYLPYTRTWLTGYPVRKEMTVRKDTAESRMVFGLDQNRFTLLVTGGSQGAKGINEVICQAAPQLVADGVQILHQTGKDAAGMFGADVSGWVKKDYIEDMASAYAAADIAICRGGASTLCEMAVQSLCAVIVPYPYHKDEHQKVNARELEQKGCAILLEQKNMSEQSLMDTVTKLRYDEGLRNSLKSNFSKWAKPDAADKVALAVIELAKYGKLTT